MGGGGGGKGNQPKKDKFYLRFWWGSGFFPTLF